MKERGKARPGVKSQANSYTKVWVSINDSQSINQSKLLEQWSRRRRRLGSEWTRNEAEAEAEGNRIQWNFLHAFLLYFCCAASSSSSSSFSSYSSVWLVSALICALPANDCSCLLHLDSQFKKENEGREKKTSREVTIERARMWCTRYLCEQNHLINIYFVLHTFQGT